MAAQDWGAGGYAYPAYELAEALLLLHTGTLDTTGHGNGISRTVNKPGTNDDQVIGPDTSARAISPYISGRSIFDVNPASLPTGYEPGPAYNAQIF